MFLGSGIAFLALRDDGGSQTSSDSQPPTADSGSPTTLKPINVGLVCAIRELVIQALEDFGVDDLCEIDPEDFWDWCDEEFMPCYVGRTPLIKLNYLPGISHDGSVPDADTGQVGPSHAFAGLAAAV